ncbi:MAG: hypothetical protein WCQ97_05425 [Aminobacterium sp.]|uniref:DNA polymerase III subunit delta n=1 Tax=unclassified Aminobacterium TaxID=2685012 RepID=UPI001BD1A584|nr:MULTISPECIES: hypothetical protein [unclassified Aminobacterium]MDD2206502.1 hypothetical protein [Aminobacterium sp.]MDD3426668.1 hypothetical protein [Aminobacterium sp.]MDD3706993.1 hypothetical protein [Aminobacterium sp.]MDD4551343.1 hypothetical protein [Aminobacterium sp.]MEA4878099.1 hypothetical protein [Aminobacterium sp.]
MPRIVIISASEVSQRRLLSDTLRKYEHLGYVLSGRKEGSSWQEVLALGQNRGLFDDKQMLLVENAEDLGVLPENMLSLIDTEEENFLVMLVYDGSPSKYIPKEILRHLDIYKAEEIPFWTSARLRWLLDFCRDKKIDIDREAAALLVDWIEDGEELRSEVEKIAVFSRNKRITTDVVKALSFDEGRNSMLRFLDGLCQADRKEIITLLPHLQQDVPFLQLVTAVYNRLKPVLYKYFFPTLSEREILTMLKVRSYAGKMAAEAIKHYDRHHLCSFIIELAGLSYGEKTGMGTGWVGFEAMIFRLLDSDKRQ